MVVLDCFVCIRIGKLCTRCCCEHDTFEVEEEEDASDWPSSGTQNRY